MIIYSVTVAVNESIAEEWLDWMLSVHIPEVMDTGMFTNYHIQRILFPEPENSTQTFNIQYECLSMLHFKMYQEQYAAGLQAAHTQRYKDKFAAFRTILERIN